MEAGLQKKFESMLQGKKIILGVTGGIAAYKSAVLTRMLVREGAEVRVVMTSAAQEFITPLTMATLSKNPVMTDFFKEEDGRWNSHIELGLWGDLYVIAPATANTMGKMVAGIADNLLLATWLSARCPVFVAPAMDMDMLAHRATVTNIESLRQMGCHIIDPGSGELASGLEGRGRMAEPEIIVEELRRFLKKKKKSEPQPLKGRRVFINAGPTIEPVDPVRFISNHSSGRMGIALADAAAAMGAEVTLVLGPVNLRPAAGNITIVSVTTAAEMTAASLEAFNGCDIAILAAAVADFTPERASETKLKRGGEELVLRLKPTEDIAARLGSMKREGQLVAGFALETDNELANAIAKMKRKNLDMIILNSLRESGAGFGHETNRVTIINRNNNIDKFGLKPKEEVAIDILNKIISLTDRK